MSHAARNAVVLWTGGKDSCLALHEALASGCCVRGLVTFAPPEPLFLAHPVVVMQAQARALDLPHRLLTVEPPHEESYTRHIRALREQGVDLLITGDIAEVGGSPNWIRRCAEPAGMTVWTPLWGRARKTLLDDLLTQRFHVRFSCVKTDWLDAAWLGRELNAAAIAELQAVRARSGLDLCGEEGEYHTIVTDAPRFRQRLQLTGCAPRPADQFAHWHIGRVELCPKE
ncbi:MAG: hypothetical protein B9S33_01655 [Pedosphaera sp. Tous-C6FEB]|nr:MAG: hypothetical protein B9S33_01655 [Pedosphaera sp. Tous-C6FEB]